jgi:predicted transposase YbfD/YdcC
VVVESKENEIVAAPRALKSLDLRGTVVTADVLLAPRNLSIQIVEAGGDAKRVWTLKDNRPETRQVIETLFQPEACVPGFRGGSHDFRTAHTIDKAHGRLEQRTITISSERKEYLDWPDCEQGFKLERMRIQDSKVMDEVVYGLTSLTADEAGPEQVLDFVRGQWGIEKGLHYRRDATLREDWCCVRVGRAPQRLTLINNLVLGLLSRRGVRNVLEARRRFAAHLNEAVQVVLGSSV